MKKLSKINESICTLDTPINYIGYLTAPNGLGIGARKYLDALWNQGFTQINCVDITTIINHPSTEKLRYHAISHIKKAPINILHVNAHELPNMIKCLGNKYFINTYNIGIWAWELPNFPSEWHDRFDLLNEIWALSSFTAKSLSMCSTIPVIPIPYCISEIPNIPERAQFDLPEHEFTFLFSFDYQSIAYRKNPEAVITAFRLAFSPNEPVRLVIKTNHASSNDIRLLEELTQNLRVTMINKTFTTETQHALIASCDCYVSLHRAEGLGLGMAEAMSLGKPVIATGWSGNTDFMNICNAFLVEYQLKTLKKSFSVYPMGSIVAEPDIEHAAELMQTVYNSPELRNRIGLRAKRDIHHTLSEKNIGNMIKDRLLFVSKKIFLKKQKPKFNVKICITHIKKWVHSITLKNQITSLTNLTIIRPYFDKDWYCSYYQINLITKRFALIHYRFIGWKKGWQPHPLFDVTWYLHKYPDVKNAKIDPLQHYVTYGWKENRSPHLLFNSPWYLMQNTDVARANIEPFLHYLMYGWKEGRQPHALFNPDWYLLQWHNLSNIEPLAHYLSIGWKQSKSPSYFFDDIVEIEDNFSLINYILKEGDNPNSSLLQSKHSSLINLQCHRITLFFGNNINKVYCDFLIDYIALLSLIKKCRHTFTHYNGIPCIIINDKPIYLYHRSAMAKLYHMCFPTTLNKKICFVLLQHNHVELTKQCVSTILNLPANECSIEIIIVDNRSDDAVIKETREYFSKISGITLLCNPNNDGFSKGNNIGYRFAKKHFNADYIIVLNNDTKIIDTQFIHKSIELFDEYAYSILGPDIMTSIGGHDNPLNNYIYDDKGWKKIHTIYKKKRESFKAEGNAQFIKQVTSPEKHILFNPILQGAAYIFSPIFIKQHDDVFDERIFLYGEEFLLATHCLLSGDLMIYSNQLKICHRVAGSTSHINHTDKLTLNYDNVITASNLCGTLLERQAEASEGIPIAHSSPKLKDLLHPNFIAIGINLLDTQLHIDNKSSIHTFFKDQIETYALRSDATIWVTLNINLFIDESIMDLCKKYSINIIAVESSEDVKALKENYAFNGTRVARLH